MSEGGERSEPLKGFGVGANVGSNVGSNIGSNVPAGSGVNVV